MKHHLMIGYSYFLDVNECALNRDNCAQNCINTNGGFRCSCRAGYSLLSNGRSCGGECVNQVQSDDTTSHFLLSVPKF